MTEMNSSLIQVKESTINDDAVEKLVSEINKYLQMDYAIDDLRSCVVLDMIAELAYLDHKIAHKLLKKVDTNLIQLKDAVMVLIENTKHSCKPNEFDLHRKFFDNLKLLIPNAKVVSEDVIKEHRPDGFLDIDNELYVVEMKLNVFDVSALKQICRYMRNYNAKGVAVAPKLSCVLPENVIFIELAA